MSELSYVPIKKVEDLLLAAKHSLRWQHGMLESRSRIEQTYAEQLDRWVSSSDDMIRQQSDADPLRAGLLLSLDEARDAASRHRCLAELLLDANGPHQTLVDFRLNNFKQASDLKSVVGNSRRYVLQTFNALLTEYSEALDPCLRALEAVDHSDKKLDKYSNLLEKLTRDNERLCKYVSNQASYATNAKTVQNRMASVAAKVDVCVSRLQFGREKAVKCISRAEVKLDEKMHQLAEFEQQRLRLVAEQWQHYLQAVTKLGHKEDEASMLAINELQLVDSTSSFEQWLSVNRTVVTLPAIRNDLPDTEVHYPARYSTAEESASSESVSSDSELASSGSSTRITQAWDKDTVMTLSSSKGNKSGHSVSWSPMVARGHAGNAEEPTLQADDSEKQESSSHQPEEIQSSSSVYSPSPPTSPLSSSLFEIQPTLSSSPNRSSTPPPRPHEGAMKAMKRRSERLRDATNSIVVAQREYTAQGLEQLSLSKGDRLRLRKCEPDSMFGFGWKLGGRRNGPREQGMFPLTYVALLDDVLLAQD